jgi:hypothetical protein
MQDVRDSLLIHRHGLTWPIRRVIRSIPQRLNQAVLTGINRAQIQDYDGGTCQDWGFRLTPTPDAVGNSSWDTGNFSAYC